jgi:hypothetical protein
MSIAGNFSRQCRNRRQVNSLSSRATVALLRLQRNGLSPLAPLATGFFAPVAWFGPKALTLVGLLRCPWDVGRLGWGGFRFGHG